MINSDLGESGSALEDPPNIIQGTLWSFQVVGRSFGGGGQNRIRTMLIGLLHNNMNNNNDKTEQASPIEILLRSLT
jgi:hypothetical protein